MKLNGLQVELNPIVIREVWAQMSAPFAIVIARQQFQDDGHYYISVKNVFATLPIQKD
jgi:hypothetical protein